MCDNVVFAWRVCLLFLLLLSDAPCFFLALPFLLLFHVFYVRRATRTNRTPLTHRPTVFTFFFIRTFYDYRRQPLFVCCVWARVNFSAHLVCFVALYFIGAENMWVFCVCRGWQLPTLEPRPRLERITRWSARAHCVQIACERQSATIRGRWYIVLCGKGEGVGKHTSHVRRAYHDSHWYTRCTSWVRDILINDMNLLRLAC